MRKRLNRLVWGIFAILIAGCSLPVQQGGEEVAQAITGAPTVTLAAPLPNATYLAGVAVNIQATIGNAGETLDRVEVEVDDVVISTLPAPEEKPAVFSITQPWYAEGEGEHTITVTAYRADGTTSDPTAVTVNVVGALPTREGTPEPTEEVEATPEEAEPVDEEPTATPEPEDEEEPTATNTLEPTDEPEPSATPTSSVPTVRVRDAAINVRRGPSTRFDPPLGALVPNQDAPVLGTNTDGTWIKIRWGTSGEAWISAALVEVSGDISSLPKEAGPPIPTLPPATPVPPTAVPATAAPATAAATGTAGAPAGGSDLAINGFELVPAPPGIFRDEEVVARVNVVNQGGAATSGPTRVLVSIADQGTAGNNVQGTAEIPRALNPGENFLVEVRFRDTAPAGNTRVALAIVDDQNQVGESNEGNNTSAPIQYILGAR